ncbi:MAG TPA: response regulator transcription factor [Crocinitomix sp.]|nr:response regulator transcription factor [Crocinitomix sp.]
MISYDKVFDLTKNLTILYVEDDRILLEETSENFENMFLKVDTAIDGEEGFKKYLKFFQTNSKHYDIVITDINMPKINGIDLIKKIYNENENQSIIVISAHNESQYLLDLVNLGIEQFLIKPHNYTTILDILYKTANKILKSSKIIFNVKKNELNNDYYWDSEDNLLFFHKENIKLTKNETLLMQIFIKNRYKISTLQEIYNILWIDTPHLASIETLKSIISRLRKKIPNTVENVYGLGYRLIF